MDFDYCYCMMTELALNNEAAALENFNDINRPISYNELLVTNLLCGGASYAQPRPLLATRSSAIRESRVVGIATSTPRLVGPVTLPPRAALMENESSCSRYIPSSPWCILDAPGIRNDFYLNVMDWGGNDIIAIGINQLVYLFITTTGKTQKITACTDQGSYVTSVAWIESKTMYRRNTHQLAVGTSQAELQIWDVETFTKIRTIYSHQARIASLSWSSHGALATGSRDSTIHLNDVRCDRHLVGRLKHHRDEVCGLAWSPDGRTLASGSEDNSLCLWDYAMVRADSFTNISAPRSCYLDHRAAVRALAWSPSKRNLLVSGGGTADSTIKIWSTSNDRLIRSVFTGSQVCGVAWSTTTQELVSAHGHCSEKNQLTLWKYPTMKCIRELTGHTARVLHLAISPNGFCVASVGADETLRFWNMFPSSQGSCITRNAGSEGHFNLSTAIIR
ncbi:unnamed protein product [Phytophthora lilii]|uniref:Unnamed protein product n=1 Tax=Phytophthora lilii TaxID=2077276 RepID=A0A9W6TDM4_9STRA|nr:unnamed protein product [Phytophthora lilii]